MTSSTLLLTVILCLFLSFDAGATAGDYVVRRNSANTDTLPNTGSGDLLLLWDAAVANVGSGITYSSGTFTLGETGLFLVMASDRAGTSTTGNRMMWKMTLNLAGSELKEGYSTGWIRATGGHQDAISYSAAIINVTGTAGNLDDLQVRSERADLTTPANPVARIPDRSGITIIKLDDAANYARYESSAFFTDSTTDDARVLANIRTNLEQESPFTRTTDTVDIATNNMVLAVYTMQTEETTGGTDRHEWQSNLELAGTAVPGSWNLLYLRYDQDTDWVSATGVTLLRPTSGDDLTLGLTTRELGQAKNWQASLQLFELPSGAETAIMEATTGTFNTDAAANFAWDTRPQIDAAAFTATAGNSNIDVDNAGDYIVAAGQAVAGGTAGDQRAGPAVQFRINTTDDESVGHSSYNRNVGTSGHASVQAATLLTGLAANDSIHVRNDRIGTVTTDVTNSSGAFSVIRLDSLFAAGPATPLISSAANQSFTVGDSATAISTVTVTDDATTAQITTGNDIRIRIPAGFNMTWDPADTTAVIGGAASTKVSTTVTYEDTNGTLVLDVTSNFAAGDQITVSGLSFTSFSAASGADNLELEVNNDNVVSATDDKTIEIHTPLTTSSAANQTFTVGDSATAISTLTVTDHSGTASITTGNDIRIRIPASFNMTWDPADTTAVIGGAASTKVSTTVTYEDTNGTLVLDVTSNFAAGDQITVSGLSFTSFGAASAADNLELEVNNDNVVSATDDKTIEIHTPLSISSAANQSFSVGDPATAISTLTVTDHSGTASITTGNDIRIRIPAGFNMTWDPADTTAVIGGAASTKVSTTVTYEDTNGTLVLDVTSNFAAGDQITVSGLSFTSFSAASAADNLELEINNDNVVSATDDKTIQIDAVATVLSSAGNQSFTVGDSATAISTVTVTDDATTAQITTGNDIRIRIPAGFNMTWDPSDTTAVIGGAASTKVSTTVSYEDTNGTLVLDVTSNFAAGDQITVSGLSFTSFSAGSAADNLELEVKNDNVVSATDDKTVQIDALLLISSAANQSFTVSDPATAISTVTISDAFPTATITTGNDIRIRIPAGFNMTWDPADTTAVIGGAASTKVSTTVTYEDTNGTLVLDVTSNFAAGDQITVSGLSFTSFSAASAADNLELEVNNDNVVSATDDKTIQVDAPLMISSAANQTFTAGDSATAISTITLTDDTSTPAITALNDIRIRIPAGFNMTWDPADTTAVIGGAASTKVSTTVLYEDTNGTLLLDVTSDFAAGDQITVSGLSFTSFSAGSAADNLELEVNNDNVVSATDDKTIAINGAPAMSSAGNQSFTAGDSATAISTITVTDDAGIPTITAANDIRIRIPAGFNMTWDATDTTAVIGGAASTKVSTTVTYEDTNGTLVLDVTTGFAAGDQITVSGLSFTSFSAGSATDNLELEVNNDNVVSATDDKTIEISAVPAMSSAANQSFATADPATAISTITVTDDAGIPTITVANDIRIRIPAGFNMTWDATDTTAVIGGAASTKVSTTVTYEDTNGTLVLDVTTGFAAGDAITVSGLSFTSFSAVSAADNLELEVNNDNVVSATDDKTVTVLGAPVISSAANQTFATGDPATPISTLTVTDDPTAPTITAANDIRIRIPSGFNMTWDPTDTTAVIGGAASTKVSTTVTYEDTNGTLVLDVTTGFAAGDQITVSGLSFTSFSASSVTDNLELEVNNDNVVYATDDKTIEISATTVISSGSNQTIAVGSPATSIRTITVTDSAVSATITTTNDIRIRIPAGFNMTWDASDTTAVIGGAAVAKVSTTVSYEDSNGTLVLDVTSDFAASDEITISGLSFTGFSAVSAVDNLELEVNNDNVVSSTDDKTIEVNAPMLMSSAANQTFTVGDSATAISTITVTDNGVTPTITAVNDLRIRIPAGFDMTWDATDTTAVIGGAASTKVSATVTYEDTNATLVLDVTSDFAASDQITVSGLSFTSFSAAEPADFLALEVNNDNLVSTTDDKTIKISGVAAMSSAGSQTFDVGDPATAISTITVTDNATAAQVTAANDIRIRVPSGFNMTWDPADTTAVIGGAASAKVSTTVSYEDTNGTLVLDVTSDFAAGDAITVSGLSFTSFSAASSADNLELEVKNDNVVSATDDKTVTINDAPLISSAANQTFTAGDSATAISMITLTDAAGSPQITALNDLRIRIPAGFNMTWDPSDTTAVIGGGASTKVSTTVTYEDTNGTLRLDVTSDFAAGDQITISGLSFTSFSAASSADNLELEVNNDNVVSATDDKTIQIDAAAGSFQMATGSYTGDGLDDRGVTGAGFQPDVVIVKRYPEKNAHIRTSTMSGNPAKRFVGNLGMQADTIQSLDASGFTVGTNVFVNQDTEPYHWIAFKAAAGTLHVGSYTGDGVDDRSITGIGFQPNYVIVAGELMANVVNRSSTLSGDLSVQFRDTAPAANMIQALEADGFQVGTGAEVNSDGVTYHYVAWKATAGQMEVGSYAGNDADDRDIAVTFEPKWVALHADAAVSYAGVPGSIHRSDTVTGDISLNFNWANASTTFADTIQALQPSGFQVGTHVTVNSSGNNYHWVAFAGASGSPPATTLSSAANQTFTVGDSATAISTITVTDDATTAQITAGNDIRIRIPAGFNMVWDPADTTSVIGGAASTKVSATVSYEDTNGTLVLDVTSDFAAGDQITLSGLSFASFSGVSAADNLELEVKNDDVVSASDDKTIAISASSGTTNYRSIGTNAAVLYSTGDATSSAGGSVVTFGTGASLLTNIGQGDELVVGAQTLYVLSRDSATQVTIQGTASSSLTDPNYTIKRVYNTLQAWEDDRGGDLVAEDRSEVGVAYNDGAFGTGALIDGSTTDTTHYMTITVAAGQRHTGVAGTGAVVNAGGGVGADVFEIRDPYTTIEWLEITNFKDGLGEGVHVQDTPSGANATLKNLLIYDYDAAVAGIVAELQTTIRNTIVYAGDRGIDVRTSGTAILQNVTVYGMTEDGLHVEAGATRHLDMRNTISVGNGGQDIEVEATATIDFFGSNMFSSTSGFDPTAYQGRNQAPPTNLDDLFNVITASSEDLHLESDGHAALDSGLDLVAWFTDDIDAGPRPLGTAWDMGADEAGTPALATNYRSIGTNAAILYQTGTASITSGTSVVSFSGASLPTNVGIGDKLTIQGSVFHALSRDSSTQMTVQETASSTLADPNYTILRAYNTLQTWEDGRDGDLVAENRNEVGVAYNDGAFSGSLTIQDSTTDATHYLTLTVAPGQRHNGTAGTGVVWDAGGAGTIPMVNRDPHTRIEWFEITNTTSGISAAVTAYKTATLSHLIIHKITKWGILVWTTGNVTIRNSIIYDTSDAPIVAGLAGTMTIQNCTTYSPSTAYGIYVYSGANASIKNTIAVGATTTDIYMDPAITYDYFGNNMYATTAGFDPNAYQGNNQAPPASLEDLFVSIVVDSEDLHLEGGGHSALETGLDLSATFTGDIDSDTRSGLWDLGADEATGVLSISSDASQVFKVGDPATAILPITVTNSGTSITALNDIRISIPVGFNMVWDTGDTSAVISGSGSSKVSGTVTYADAGKTLVIDATNDFALGDSIAISGLSYTSFTAVSVEDNLELDINADATADASDDETVRIDASTASISSASNQAFGINDAATGISVITLTDGPAASITAANDIRIRIPAGLNMLWDSSDTAAVIGGGASSKVSGTVSYEDADKTLVLNVTSDFAAADVITVSGLMFTSFSAISFADSLELEALNDSGTTATDDKTITIGAFLSISSSTHQTFRPGDAATVIAPITITNSASAAITAANDIRIKIPTGFNMVWDSSDTSATVIGDASAKVLGTVSYEDSNRTLLIDVTSNFVNSEWVTVSDLSFTTFSAASAADNLELEIGGDPNSDAYDDKTITIIGPTTNYRSIGTTATVLYQTGTASISSATSTVTFTGATLPSNVGLGDKLTIDDGTSAGLPFSDDFADSVITNWTMIQGIAMVETGGVFQTSTGVDTSMHYTADPGASWADYTYSVDVKSIDDDSSRLTFRVQDLNNYYRFTQKFGNNSNWDLKLQKVVAGAGTDLATPISNNGASAGQVNSLTTWYTLKVVLSGTSIKAYIDDVLKFDVTDATYATGTVGMSAITQTDSEFDNVLVTCTGGCVPAETHHIVSRDSASQVTIQGTATGTFTNFPYTIERAYNTFQAWEDDRDGALVAEDRFEVGVAYDDGDFSAGATIDGSTTDSTHFMKITVAEGQRHAGVAGAGVLVDAQGGVADHIFTVADGYTQIEWLQVTNCNDSTTYDVIRMNAGGDNALLQYLLIHDYDGCSYGVRASGASFSVRNSIFYDGRSGVGVTNGSTGTIDSVTVYGMIGNGIQDPTGTNTTSVRNTISVGNGVPSASDVKLEDGVAYFGNNMFSTTSSFNPSAYQGNNVAPPANLDDLFVSITPGSEDFHLETSGHAALGTGLDLSGSFADDIDGDTRSSEICSGWDLGADESSATGAVCHFSLTHDGTGINCQAENITITYHGSTHNRLASYTSTITLSTSSAHGDWSLVAGSGSLSNSGNGGATYTFSPFDNGEVILGLRDTYVETTNINLTDGIYSETASEDDDLVFASSGFVFLGDGVKNTIGNQIGGKPSDVAPGAQTIELQSVRTNDETGACEAFLTGSNTVELGYKCINPSSCTYKRLSVNGVSIEENSASQGLLDYTGVSLNFGGASDSTATLVLSYPDVGKIQLIARYTLSPSGENMLGGSNFFIVRPFAFEMTPSGNPAATNPSGPIFTGAGTDFMVGARAVLWEAADDADNDGQADGHGDTDATNNANLANNASALSFGQESPGGEGIALSSSLFAPAGGNDPPLAGTTSLGGFSAGTANPTNVHYDDVGIIEIVGSINDGDYLGIGTTESAKILGRSGHVGRFTPTDFGVATNTPAFGAACSAGGFSYLGQIFGYSTPPVLTVTAQNASGGTTQNYKGSWFKLSSASLSDPNYTAFAGTFDISGLPAPSGDPAIVDNGNGTATLTFSSGSGLAFTRSNPVVPFDADIRLRINVADTDSVVSSANPVDFGAATAGGGILFSGGKQMRFGRLVVINAHGTELQDLPVPIQAQYYDSNTYWINNTDDVCSSIDPATDLNLTQSPPALSSAAVAFTPFLLGDPGLSFAKPGMSNTGYIDITVDLSTATGAGLEWLYYDWDGDSSHDDNPTGRATFGIYSGRNAVIYVRELY